MRGCAVRHGDMYTRGLIDPSGAVPVQGRGLGHTVPTYLCRSPDSILHRPRWLRTPFHEDSMILSKSDIRQAVLAKRDSTSGEWRAMASHDMARHALHAASSGPGGPVAGYWPHRTEIDPGPLMAGLRDYGRSLALPVIHHPDVIFRRYIEGVDLVNAGFGTFGPDASADVLRPTILLVPLAAFDAGGNRIGWGQGHYDRVIERLLADGEPLMTMGVAFSFQQVAAVPAEPHDRPLDFIATELGVFSTNQLTHQAPDVT
jgi:5-formyltetrahydrofolate cyclo-ligase